MSIIQNPILKGFYPDPSICRTGRDYYLVTSSFAYYPGIPVFHSRDLKNWKQIGNVLERASQLPLKNAGVSEGIFAPTIRYREGIYYVITTNVGNGGNFYVTAKDPAGPWSEPVYLEGAEGIDPSLFFDKDGSCYYVGTKERREGGAYFGDNEIWLQKLDLQKGKLIGESIAIWHGSMKKSIWPEGPHLYLINGMYYLMTAEGGTEFCHSICMARSRNLTGPYEGCPGNPVFTHRHLGHQAKVQNAGHGDLIQAENGSWYMVMLASRMQGGASNLGRETFLARVIWEEGWPVINPGERKLTETVECDLPEEELGEDFEDITIDFSKGWDKRLLSLRGRRDNICEIPLKEKDMSEENCLILHTVPETVCEKEIPAYVGIRQSSYTYRIETEMEFVPKDKDAAGLLLFQNEKNHIRLELVKRSGSYYLCCVQVKDGEETELSCVETAGKNDTEVSGERKDSEREEQGRENIENIFNNKEEKSGRKENMQGRIFLRMEGKDQKLSASCKSSSEEAWLTLAEGIDTEFLSTERCGGFVGCTMGPYATGNGKKTENAARFYTLRYEGK